ncbi:MAG: hypothetical protein ACRYG2_31430 [Janthinobacterium lividum]
MTLAEVAGELGPLLRALDAVAAGLDEHDRSVVARHLGDVLAVYEAFASPTRDRDR